MAVDRDQLLLVAIEMLRRQIADLPLALGMNADPATEPKAQMPPLSYNADGTGGLAVPGTQANPLPLPPPPPPAPAPAPPPPPPPPPPSRAVQIGGVVNDLTGRAVKPLSAASAALGKQFGAMLGPLGMLSTYMTSAGSGFSLVQGAMGMFASTIGTVVQPVMFVLSTGLTAAAQKVSRELMPAMDKFTKWVLSTGLPAMASLADAAGKAAKALVWVADSKLGQMAAAKGDNKGGQFGALDRLSGGGDVERGNKSDTTGETIVAYEKQAMRGMADLMRLAPGIGDQTADAYNASYRKTMKWVTGSDQAGDFYSGIGTNKQEGLKGGKSESMEDVLKAARLNVAEQQFRLNKGGGIGDARGVTMRAQASLMSMSPFEQESLRIQREQLAKEIEALAALEALVNGPGGGAAPPTDRYVPGPGEGDWFDRRRVMGGG